MLHYPDMFDMFAAARVCLQFPDHLLQEAPPVARLLQERLQQEVYILGDTTYGACCVDEVCITIMYVSYLTVQCSTVHRGQVWGMGH